MFNLSAIIEPQNQPLALAISALGGFNDFFNLCGLVLLIILLGQVLIHFKHKTDAHKVGFALVFGVAFSTFLVGVFNGFFAEIFYSPWHQFLADFYFALLVIIFFLNGVGHIEAFFTGKKLLMSEANYFRQLIRRLLERHGVVLALAQGFLTVLFASSCITLEVVFLAPQMYQTFGFIYSSFLFIVYSAMHALPLLIIFALILKSQSFVRVDLHNSDRNKKLKLIKGLIQIVLAVTLYLIFFHVG